MRSIRLRAFGVLAVGMYLGLGLGSATAGDDTVKSKVKITEGGATHFEGTVTSKKSKCEKGRKVSLSYQDGGPYKRGEVIDSDRTDADGDWELNGSFQAGLYQAKVTEKQKGDLSCLADKTVRLQF